MWIKMHMVFWRIFLIRMIAFFYCCWLIWSAQNVPWQKHTAPSIDCLNECGSFFFFFKYFYNNFNNVKLYLSMYISARTYMYVYIQQKLPSVINLPRFHPLLCVHSTVTSIMVLICYTNYDTLLYNKICWEVWYFVYMQCCIHTL